MTKTKNFDFYFLSFAYIFLKDLTIYGTIHTLQAILG